MPCRGRVRLLALLALSKTICGNYMNCSDPGCPMWRMRPMAIETKGARRAEEVAGERQKTKKNRRTRRAMKPQPTQDERAVAKLYEPTPEELDAVRAHLERQKRKPPMPRFGNVTWP